MKPAAIFYMPSCLEFDLIKLELNTLIKLLCTREYDSQCSKDFVRLLSIINVYLGEKTTV